MRRRLPRLVLAALLVSTAAHADDHIADVFGGGSYGRGSTLWGGHVSFARTLPVLGDNLSVVIADFSAHEKHVISFAAGGRFDFIRGHRSKVVPFGQFMVGALHNRDGDQRTTGWSYDIGGGLDLLWRRDENTGAGWGFRVQVDDVIRPGDAENLFRVSVGMLVRIGKPAKPQK